ncbi:MAG: LysR family transcriptional regulator [Peptococcaceae bacterium]|nr:LysR family transcriptional regulator [Peptococcaceae bacterium]
MEMHQLEYVLAVAKFHNFTRAAEEIKISQSSLSQQISKLENELGTNLFVRTTRSVHLTPAGAEFIKHAQRIMSEVKEARRSIQDYVSMVKGELAFGTIPVIGSYNVPNLLKSFQDNYPGIKMRIVEEQCEDLLSMLQSAKIDVAMTQMSKNDNNLKFYPLLSDRMVLVTSSRHPLANKETININELRNEKLIMTPRTSGHHHDFCRACEIAGFTPNIVIKCSIVKTMLSFVREEIGITVLSSKVAAAEKDPSMRIIEITPTIPRRISLATRNTSDPPPTLKMFLKFTNQWVKTQKSREAARKHVARASLTSRDIRLIYSR